MHRDLDVTVPFTARNGRKFGFSVGAAFFVLAAVLALRGHVIPAYGSAGFGLFLVLSALVTPARLGPVYRAWMAMALAISKVTTPVFMSVIYSFVLTPTGVVRRVFGRNPLQRQATVDSYWVPRGTVRRSDLRRQF